MAWQAGRESRESKQLPGCPSITLISTAPEPACHTQRLQRWHGEHWAGQICVGYLVEYAAKSISSEPQGVPLSQASYLWGGGGTQTMATRAQAQNVKQDRRQGAGRACVCVCVNVSMCIRIAAGTRYQDIRLR